MKPPSNSKFSPWPFAIGAYFVVAILGIITFIVWSTSHRMELVRADYYEHEILFQQEIDARNRTAALGNHVAIHFDADGRRFHVRVPESHAHAGLQGKAHFYRPNNSRLDRVIALHPNQSGEQIISAENLLSGLWRIRLEWTANSALYSYEKVVIAED